MPKIVQPQLRGDHRPVHVSTQVPRCDQTSPGSCEDALPRGTFRHVLLQVAAHRSSNGDEPRLVVLHVLLLMPLRMGPQHPEAPGHVTNSVSSHLARAETGVRHYPHV